MSILDKVLEQRDAAVKECRELGERLTAPDAAPTAEDEAKLNELRESVAKFDERIVELNAEARRSAEVEEIRKQITAPVIEKIKEARTYGPGSDSSYFADFVRASSPMWPGHDEARQRLNKYAAEVAGEMRDDNSVEGKRARRSVSNVYRENNPQAAKDAVERAAAYTFETRAGMDTTSGSGGSFVTPQYFVAEYAPYRQFNRVFANAANKQELPSYGMTIYMPQVTTAAGVAAQSSQNSGIAETDPTAGYLSTSLTTNAGQVTISQQLLDRAGPNFAFDKMVFDQLNRAYDLVLDQYVLTQALANAGSVSMTTTTLTQTGGLLASIGKAKANIADTAGTILPATHIFAQPVNAEWYFAQVDSTYRPLVTPTYAGPYNAVVAGGDGTPIADGYTGYHLSGLPVYEDGNIPTSATYNQVIVAHMPEVYFWEGDLVSRVIPQTFAQNLSVLLQVYSYVGAIVRYPKAVQAINGSGLPTSPTF
jgi:hypothetical protein